MKLETANPIITPTLKDSGIYFLCGEFDMLSAKDVVTWIVEANLQPKKLEKLILMINSPGGCLWSAFAIIDAMRGSSIPVHTVGIGIVASCGLLAFIAGAKGNRILTPNTLILSHQYSSGVHGKEHDLLTSVKRFELQTTVMINHYKKCCGLTEKIIREKLLPASDVWLSTDEALKFKLCDQIKYLK